MSKVEYGQFTVLNGYNGNELPTLTDSSLVVQRVVLFISSSATESSAGYHDASVDFTGSAAYQDENTTKTITHYRNIGGVKTKVFEAKITNMDIGEFTINVTTCTQNTSLKFVAFGV